MFDKKLQNGLEKLRVNKKIRGRKVKNNGIEVKSYKKLVPNALQITY